MLREALPPLLQGNQPGQGCSGENETWAHIYMHDGVRHTLNDTITTLTAMGVCHVNTSHGN